MIAIDVTDPLAENLNDIHDVDKIMPGFLKVNKAIHCVGERLPTSLQKKQSFLNGDYVKILINVKLRRINPTLI